MEEIELFFFLNKKEIEKVENDILGIKVGLGRKRVLKESYKGVNSPTQR